MIHVKIIDLIRSPLPTTYPYVIMREYFIVQDARPLYCWPEKKITPTKHDNWEPQFKPKVIERPKSAVPVPVPVVVMETSPVPVPEEEDDDYDNEEEAGDMVEGEPLTGEEYEQVEPVEEEGQEYYGEEYNAGEEYVGGSYEEEDVEDVYESYEEQAISHK